MRKIACSYGKLLLLLEFGRFLVDFRISSSTMSTRNPPGLWRRLEWCGRFCFVDPTRLRAGKRGEETAIMGGYEPGIHVVYDGALIGA